MKILCVDDEVEITKALELYLRRFYQVLTANNPLEAIELVKDNDDIQIIISDYIMPEMNGCEFFKRVVSINDKPYRVILSGYSNDIDIKSHMADHTVQKYLTKPWRLKELHQLIQTIENEID